MTPSILLFSRIALPMTSSSAAALDLFILPSDSRWTSCALPRLETTALLGEAIAFLAGAVSLARAKDGDGDLARSSTCSTNSPRKPYDPILFSLQNRSIASSILAPSPGCCCCGRRFLAKNCTSHSHHQHTCLTSLLCSAEALPRQAFHNPSTSFCTFSSLAFCASLGFSAFPLLRPWVRTTLTCDSPRKENWAVAWPDLLPTTSRSRGDIILRDAAVDPLPRCIVDLTAGFQPSVLAVWSGVLFRCEVNLAPEPVPRIRRQLPTVRSV